MQSSARSPPTISKQPDFQTYHPSSTDIPQPTLELVCEPCGRRGRYDVERLAARHGNAKLSEVAANHRRLPQGKGVWRLIVRPAGRATGRMTAVGRRGLTLQIAPPFARTT